MIRAGFEAGFDFSGPTAVLLLAYVHPSRATSLRVPDCLAVTPRVAITEYTDVYGNRCGRTVVPAGHVVFRNDILIEDDGLPDVQMWNRVAIPGAGPAQRGALVFACQPVLRSR